MGVPTARLSGICPTDRHFAPETRLEAEREGYTLLGQELTPQTSYDGPEDRPVPPVEDRDAFAKPAQTFTLEEWRQAFEERKKLHGSGFAIVEEVKDPSEKT